jgi:hypothetical protein
MFHFFIYAVSRIQLCFFYTHFIVLAFKWDYGSRAQAAELLIIWKIFLTIVLPTQCRRSISLPMRAVYAASCPHITTTPACIPHAFRHHRQWRVTAGGPLHD